MKKPLLLFLLFSFCSHLLSTPETYSVRKKSSELTEEMHYELIDLRTNQQ